MKPGILTIILYWLMERNKSIACKDRNCLSGFLRVEGF